MAPLDHDPGPPFQAPAVLSAAACVSLQAHVIFSPLTVMVCPESLGFVCWQQLQEQVATVCSSQQAAVFQYSSPRVRIYCLVFAALLRPVGRIEERIG